MLLNDDRRVGHLIKSEINRPAITIFVMQTSRPCAVPPNTYTYYMHEIDTLQYIILSILKLSH